jgi:hypothetical protein
MIKLKSNLELKILFFSILIIWVGLDVASSLMTEIMSDEAYYSMYGENLAWGYYDHPPMTGLITFISATLFSGNLSVRFMTIVLHLFTVVFLGKLVAEKSPDREKILLFFIISASMVMFQAYGFVTTPDISLLFFTAIFLLVYQYFIKNDSWTATLGLSLSMACMMYSKYHAVLIIGLIILSNIRLLTNYKFWISIAGVIVFLIPHLKWQLDMDFPSIRYHLDERSSVFRWAYFFEYIPNQLVVFNPFTFGAIIYVLVKYRSKDIFERGLFFLIIGFILFFWLMSLRGHVEPHWTVVCSIPSVIILYRYSLIDNKLKRYIKTWVAASILLVLAARIILTTDLLPARLDFYGKEARNKALESVAGDLPVVFTGSFQNPSNYHFFTKKESFVLSAIDSRQTQFDIWQKELKAQGKPVFIEGYREGKSEKFLVDGYEVYGYFASNFQSVNRVKIDYSLPEKEASCGDTLHFEIFLTNPTDRDLNFHHPEFPVTCLAIFAENDKKGKIFSNSVIFDNFDYSISAQSAVKCTVSVIVPELPSATYKFSLSLDNTICRAKNSKSTLLAVFE